ncbi:MAG TPA: hypothetical protein VM939_09595 [Gemmatimonadaceae bacterium]|nr:hypothetical protein [Gemmatimonadaceae bacterium]
MTALIVGTLLALVALSFVLYPLLVSALPGRAKVNQGAQLEIKDRPATAVETLREIEFDRATGKLSERDYGELKAEYTRQAIAVMRAGDSVICEQCGPRPESDAHFCSNCGRELRLQGL